MKDSNSSTHLYLDYRDRLRITINSKGKRSKFKINSSIFEDGSKEFNFGSILNALNEITFESEAFYTPFRVELYINDTFLTDITA